MTDLSTPTLTALDEDRTPGKWGYFTAWPNMHGVTPNAKEDADIAHCHGFSSARRDEEVGANARLCALAPDLLAEVLRGREREAELLAEIERLRKRMQDIADLWGAQMSDSDRVLLSKTYARAALKPQEE